MFQAKAARDDIGRALLSEIDRLKQELGVDGYMDAFDQPFPARAAEALRAALAVEQPERRGVGFNSSEFYETRFDSKA
ncbi:MAG: hypothetical protein K0R83_2089 [Caulobacter sp.]|nr:hypothetical protein [Caulobacter sp.]